MKKLLIVTDAWFPQVNGVVTVFDTITTFLRQRNIEVAVVHPRLFAHVYPFPLYPEVELALFPGRRMREIFLREKPDYVHIATEWTIGIAARRFCLRKNIPFTTSYHTNFPLYAAHYFGFGKIFSSLASRYMHWFHGASQAIMVSNPSLKSQLEGEGYAPVVLWPFGIDTKRFVRNESRAPKLNIAHPVFVYFGRIAKEKDVEEFLRAQLPGTKLVIGDGPQRAELEKKYGNEALFVGYKRGQELVDMLSLCDVCVFPSRTETFGMVGLEALACGIPVAAHDVLGPHDFITPGVDGMLDEDLGRAAIACLTLSREDCHRKALQYSWDSSADIFLEHVQKYV